MSTLIYDFRPGSHARWFSFGHGVTAMRTAPGQAVHVQAEHGMAGSPEDTITR